MDFWDQSLIAQHLQMCSGDQNSLSNLHHCLLAGFCMDNRHMHVVVIGHGLLSTDCIWRWQGEPLRLPPVMLLV